MDEEGVVNPVLTSGLHTHVYMLTHTFTMYIGAHTCMHTHVYNANNSIPV